MHTTTTFKKFLFGFFDILIFISLLFLFALTAQAISTLEASSSTNKQVYEVGESIEASLEIANHTGTGVTLTFLTGCQMSVEIYSFNEKTFIYNDILYPRNCAVGINSVFLNNDKKAIWYRTVDLELQQGKYRLHSYPTGYERAEWAQALSTFVEFEVKTSVPAEIVENPDINSLEAEITSTTDPDMIETSLEPETNSTGIEIIELSFSGFNDIQNHWGENYITSLQESDVVSGYSDGGYHPNEPINRAEFVKMALSAVGIKSEPPSDDEFLFDDLVDWQTDWVFAAWKRTIVQGYTDTLFAPAKNVTRGEALKIALNAFNVDVTDTSQEYAFPDTTDHWALSYINQAYLDFVVSGRSDGLFYPNEPITRAEAAKVIYSLLNKS